MESNQRKLITVIEGQTGDIIHVAAALAIYPNIDVLVLLDIKDDASASESLIKTFIHAANPDGVNRVKQYRASSLKLMTLLYSALKPSAGQWIEGNNSEQYMALKTGMGTKKNLQAFIDEYLSYKGGAYKRLSLVDTTELIAQHFESAKNAKVPVAGECALYNNLAPKLANPPILDLDTLIKDGELPSPKEKQPILLLWSRYTGQNEANGYNPAGDSDLMGQQHLLELARKLKFIVVTIGHCSIHKPYDVKGDYHLGEFYLKPALRGQGREAQVSFYIALMQRYPGKIVQMGQKTGAMDAAALVGMPTLYIEDKKSPTEFRMKKWVGPMSFYCGALIEDPPTLLGKYIRKIPLANPKPSSEEVKKQRADAREMLLKDVVGDKVLTQDSVDAAGKSGGGGLEKLIYELQDPKKLEPMWHINVGYSKKDLETIKIALEKLKDSMESVDAIIRTKSGYVLRIDYKEGM